MKKKCPNCGFNINKFSCGTKRYPHVCSQCQAELYMPGWIDWLATAFMMVTPLVFFLFLTVVSLEIAFVLIGLYALAVVSINRFFKPVIKKTPRKQERNKSSTK